MHIRPICPWFDHCLDPPLDRRLRVGSVPDHRADGEPAKCPESHAGVSRTGETQLPSPQRTLLLLLRYYGLIPQSQRPLLYFGFPSWEESSQVVTSPCCPPDLPDVISENLSLDAGSHTPAVPQRALTCFFRCLIGLPHEGQGRLPANSPLETTRAGR